MKRLFAFVLAFLMMSSALLVTADEENGSNPLNEAIKEICSAPHKIESLNFSINPGHGKAEPFWKDYSYFTKDKESLLEAAQLLSKLEVSTEGERVAVSDACSAFLEIKMKDGRTFKLSYNDINSIFYNGREYCGNIYDFADALYDTRRNEEPNSIVMPISEENGYTVDLREFDVSRITYTECYDDGTKKFMTVEDYDSVDKLIGIIRRKMALTYDGVTSEIPENSAILTVEYDDSFLDTDVLYILPGKIDGKNVTDGRVWYEGKEYALDTLILDGFEGELENIASSESKVYESNSVLYDCVNGDAEISAIGYERCAKEEGKKNGYYDFFTVVRDTEYIDDIAELFKSAKVVDISEDTPFKTNKYYTETINLMYEDGSVQKIVIDGNKLFYDGKEYRIYGLSDIYETVCEETRKARPALECYGEVYDLAIWGEVYSLDGEYWFNGIPSGKKGTVTKDEVNIDIKDVDIVNYIMWLLNSSAIPYDGSMEIRPSLDIGTELYIDTDDGVVVDIAFCNDMRVIMAVGEHMTPGSWGMYMLPYDTAIEIFNILLDSSDGKLENVQDVEAATDALVGGFYEKCERIGEEEDDPSADDMKGTALADDIAVLLSKPSDIQSFYFCAETLGNVARSKADAPYNFSYMTSDSAYIYEAVKMLSDCEFSKKPKIHEEVGYTDVSIRFETKNGKFELKAFSNGKVSYNGTYYGYLSDMCNEVYKLRAKEAGNGCIVKSGVSGKYDIDLFSNNVTKLIYNGKDMGAVVIDDAEKIEKIAVYAANYITLTGVQSTSSDAAGGIQPDTLTVEYANGEKSKITFIRPFGESDILLQSGVSQYTVPSYDFYTVRRFFEIYAKYESLMISDWAKPELEKAVLYGFGGIGDFSDDYSRNLTRLEVCDILVYPVNDIIGISTACIEPAYIDVYSQSVLDLTSVGAVEGKDVITVGGAIWKRVFAPNDLVTREELAKIVAGIYLNEEDEDLNPAYKPEYELRDITKTSFNDDDAISDWAKPYVEFTRELGIFKGDDKGNFNPKSNCTKEEVVAVGVRLYEIMLEGVK